MPAPTNPPPSQETGPSHPRPRRTWRAKFGEAFRGLKEGTAGQSSFRVHFFFTGLVLIAATVFRCDYVEWCILLLCIGGVLTAELINSAIEILCRALDPQTRERALPCFDIAAGAVLVASMTTALVGAIIFVRKLIEAVSRSS